MTRAWTRRGAPLCAVIIWCSLAGCNSGFYQAQRAFEDGDDTRALEQVTPLAKQGHPRAQFLLGLMHEQGRGVPGDVAEAAVLGVPDARLGERVVAVVCLESGARDDEEMLREHCRELLARYKVPDRIGVVERLPRNAMSKVVKRELLPLFDEGERDPT